jgi:hypothetical protein
MARIRTVKPEMLDDEKVAALPHLAWRLFVSLIMTADDYGNQHGAPGKIRGSALWATDATDRDTREALARLSRDSLVALYTVRGQAYVSIVGWSKHQRVDKPGRPIVPGPEQADSHTSDDSRDPRECLARTREDLGTDHDLDHDHEGTGNGSDLHASRAESDPPAKRSSRKRPAIRIPDDFAPDDTHRTFAQANALDLDAEVEAFRLHHEAKGSVFASWSAALSTWLRNAVKFRRSGPQGGGRRGGYGATAGSEVADLLSGIPSEEFHPNAPRKNR